MRILRHFVWLIAPLSLACDSSPQNIGAMKPVYNQTTGRLEQLTADRDGDGKVDTRAYMSGVHLRYIEVDLDHDGRPDRWEYYSPGPQGRPEDGPRLDKGAVLARADEARGPDNKTITRREFYDHGVLSRVEEDTDFDGRLDKWEWYEDGGLVRIDLDLAGTGKPDRRMIYKNGRLDHVETDVKGDGTFVKMKEPSDAPSRPGGRQ